MYNPEYHKEYYQRPEIKKRQKKYMAKYYQNHRDELIEYNQKHQQQKDYKIKELSLQEYRCEYYSKNKEKMFMQAKKWIKKQGVNWVKNYTRKYRQDLKSGKRVKSSCSCKPFDLSSELI